jgi:hypothetical protein
MKVVDEHRILVNNVTGFAVISTTAEGLLFEDGFEAGDTGGWSSGL